MRGPRFAAISVSPSPFAGSFTAVRRRHCFPLPAVRGLLGFEGGTNKYWDKFYKRHQNKFFKDRHYLDKDWGKYFSDDSSASPNGKVVLEVGCGAGNTVFPVVAKYPKLFVHACDFSPHAIVLVKSHVDFNEDQVNAFLSDVVTDDLCDTMMPSAIDVVSLNIEYLLGMKSVKDHANVKNKNCFTALDVVCVIVSMKYVKTRIEISCVFRIKVSSNSWTWLFSQAEVFW